MECQWFDAEARQGIGQAEPVQDTRGVWADLDTGTSLAQFSRSLIDMRVDPGL